jgi:hypothetical protein
MFFADKHNAFLQYNIYRYIYIWNIWHVCNKIQSVGKISSMLAVWGQVLGRNSLQIPRDPTNVEILLIFFMYRLFTFKN